VSGRYWTLDARNAKSEVRAGHLVEIVRAGEIARAILSD
jgi:hypothetical protein